MTSISSRKSWDIFALQQGWRIYPNFLAHRTVPHRTVSYRTVPPQTVYRSEK
jgi:hypothetical protein